MAAGEDYLEAILTELKQGHRQWKRGDKLLEAFGYTRRRQTAIDLINGLLEEKGMRADPTLTTAMPLDRAITFYLKGTKPEPAAQTPGEVQEDTPVEVVELAVEDEAHSQAGEPVTVTIPQEAPAAEPGGPVDRGLIIGTLLALSVSRSRSRLRLQ